MNATQPNFVGSKMSKEDMHKPSPFARYVVSVLMEPIKKD